jgi:hypothetical protein
VPDIFETSSDVHRHEKALELHSLLELRDKSHFRECEKEMFASYPSVLNQAGGGGNAVECCCSMCIGRRLHPQNLTTSDAVFRQLPNDGRRSPRSALFCYMADENTHHGMGNPHVYGLSGAAVRSSSYIETQLDDATADVTQNHHFDALSSDSDVNEFLCDRKMYESDNDLYSDLAYDEKCKVMRELHDGLRPRAAVLTDLGYTPEDRAEKLLERINHWSSDAGGDDVDGLHEYAIAHFAASGSSHCANLNARISAVEDKHLSAEATDEAADDMNFALQRLREGIAHFEVIIRNVSRQCIPIVYSVISCALSIVKSAPLPRLAHTSAYNVLSKQKQPHCTLLNQSRARTLCRGGFIICLMKRMVASSRHITPRRLKLSYTAVAKRACDLRFVYQIIEAQTRNTCRRWMARLAIGSEYTHALFSLFYQKFVCNSARRRFLQRSSWMLQERADTPFTMVRL